MTRPQSILVALLIGAALSAVVIYTHQDRALFRELARGEVGQQP